jgi:cell pole-organizing protein PopZ
LQCAGPSQGEAGHQGKGRPHLEQLTCEHQTGSVFSIDDAAGDTRVNILFILSLRVSHHEQFVGCDITRAMQHPVYDEEVFMDEALAAIRRAMSDEDAGETTFAATEPRTSGEGAGAKPTPDAGLLSRETTAAIGSAFNRLSETAKKHEPTLEDAVRETLRPMLKSWLDENLPRVVERTVEAEIERVTRGR